MLGITGKLIAKRAEPRLVGGLVHGQAAGFADGFIMEPIAVSIESILDEFVVPRGKLGIFLVSFFTGLPGGDFNFKAFDFESIRIFF